MADRITAPVAFIDDSPKQIESAAELSPRAIRIHFVGDAGLRKMITWVEHAEHSPESWSEIERIVANFSVRLNALYRLISTSSFALGTKLD